jgi:hypothetical protein
MLIIGVLLRKAYYSIFESFLVIICEASNTIEIHHSSCGDVDWHPKLVTRYFFTVPVAGMRLGCRRCRSWC